MFGVSCNTPRSAVQVYHDQLRVEGGGRPAATLLAPLPFAWVVGGILGGAAVGAGTRRRSTVGTLLGCLAVLVTVVQAVHTGALSLAA